MKKVKQNYASTVRRRFQLKQKFALIAEKSRVGATKWFVAVVIVVILLIAIFGRKRRKQRCSC